MVAPLRVTRARLEDLLRAQKRGQLDTFGTGMPLKPLDGRDARVYEECAPERWKGSSPGGRKAKGKGSRMSLGGFALLSLDDAARPSMTALSYGSGCEATSPSKPRTHERPSPGRPTTCSS
jgi:hypothetical protein